MDLMAVAGWLLAMAAHVCYLMNLSDEIAELGGQVNWRNSTNSFIIRLARL